MTLMSHDLFKLTSSVHIFVLLGEAEDPLQCSLIHVAAKRSKNIFYKVTFVPCVYSFCAIK
jgi:hypothetical protein